MKPRQQKVWWNLGRATKRPPENILTLPVGCESGDEGGGGRVGGGKGAEGQPVSEEDNIDGMRLAG